SLTPPSCHRRSEWARSGWGSALLFWTSITRAIPCAARKLAEGKSVVKEIERLSNSSGSQSPASARPRINPLPSKKPHIRRPEAKSRSSAIEIETLAPSSISCHLCCLIAAQLRDGKIVAATRFFESVTSLVRRWSACQLRHPGSGDGQGGPSQLSNNSMS